MYPTLVHTTREALLLVVTVVSPPVAAALVVGLLVGIAQAVTQVQDQALGLAARILAVFGALAIAGPWAFEQIGAWTQRLFQSAFWP
ncbi:MAG: EscS/YscS/HrcS family type III secretion system export apparatus protein [Deltaproteobacteria bacterium]|nr:MAG: EscS/YscS/HrcS family type III secretion system export apparatus protein [Deltaproteobacteria bacterium]